MISDDTIMSTLLFLASSSCTEADAKSVRVATTVLTSTAWVSSTLLTSTSNFLESSLLVSSLIGNTTAASLASVSNPLFSDQLTDGDDKSI